jgi:predicted double-glycine peptidase
MNIKKIYADNGLAFQEAEYTCGPVTLLNVLRLKGDFSRSEEELSKLCKAQPKIGTTEEDMVKAAKALGLKVAEEKQDADTSDIEKHIDNGDFVIVCYFHAFSGEGHYALVSEYDEKAFYLRDCSLGFPRLKKKYFKRYWYNSDKSIYGWLLAVK